MSMSKRSPFRIAPGRHLPRRQALKELGALALSLNVLGSAGCGGDEQSDAMNGPQGGSAGGGAGSAGGASGIGGTSPSAAGSGGTTSASSANAGRSAAGSGGGSSGSGSAGAAAGSSGAGSAGSAGGSAGASGAGAAAGASGASGMNGAGGFIPVTFDDVPNCSLTPTDFAGEGPFFIHDDEAMDDVSIFRSDMREGKEGIELQLNLRVLDSEGDCMSPIAGVEVYVWHTDALGFYSGFNEQDPNKTYMGGAERTVQNADRFCRGAQITDERGVVSFRTLYPGWYNGRAIHIHFVALRPGSGPGTASYRSQQYMVFTTQMYFMESFSRMIHESHAPYTTRASGSGYTQYVKPQNMNVMPKTRMEGDIAVAALNIVTAKSGSRR